MSLKFYRQYSESSNSSTSLQHHEGGARPRKLKYSPSWSWKISEIRTWSAEVYGAYSHRGSRFVIFLSIQFFIVIFIIITHTVTLSFVLVLSSFTFSFSSLSFVCKSLFNVYAILPIFINVIVIFLIIILFLSFVPLSFSPSFFTFSFSWL